MKNISEPKFLADFDRRAATSRSLGCQVLQACPPKPDKDPVSLACGLQARLGWQPGDMTRIQKRKIKRFVSTWCKKNLKPIAQEEVISFDGWIAKLVEHKTYPAARIRELKQVWQDHAQFINPDGTLKDWASLTKKNKRKWFKCKSFIKEEHYAVEGWKHPRAINSRSDFFKCLVGPYFDRIADTVFGWAPKNGPSPFIKYVPVRDRPNVVKTHLMRDGARYRCTDFSSFEAHFTKQLMEIIEFELYKWMSSKNVYMQRILGVISKVLMGVNFLQFKWFGVSVDATRMSGEMNTSLGNGFSNLMMCLFLTFDSDPKAVWKGFVEGDDAVFTVDPPESAPTVDKYEEYGFNMKEVLSFKDLGEAGFCGMLFHPDDPKSTVVTDIKKVLGKTGWTSMQYVNSGPKVLNSLLRNKAHSLVNSYAGCPILQEFGHYLLRVTVEDKYMEDRLMDQMGWWERTQLLYAIKYPIQPYKPHHLVRELVERLYGITVSVQIEIEEMLRNKTKLEPLDLPQIIWPKSWIDYRTYYTMRIRDSYNCIFEVGKLDRAIANVDMLASKAQSFAKLRGPLTSK